MKQKSFIPVLLVVLAMASLTGEARQISTPGAGASPTWLPSYDWSLEIEGKIDLAAQFFVERAGRRMLIMSPGIKHVALVDQGGQNVITLDAGAVIVADDGESATLAENATEGRETSRYTLDSSQQPPRVIFYLGDKRLKISPKVPLEGATTADDILKHSPLYKKGMDLYTPMMTDIQTIKNYTGTVDIEVFFGTWCPHCKVVVPRFMKAVELAGNPNVRVSYIGVPRRFSNWPPARDKRVRSIPSFIFYQNGSETHRITGEPKKGSIEHAIAEGLAAR